MRRIKLLFCIVTISYLAILPTLSAATLKGIVIDSAKDTVVAGATVWVTQHRRVRTLKTDDSGEFTLDAIDVAMTEVVAYKEGLALGGATALIVGDASVEILLEPGDLITLKTIDSRSKPVPGVLIRSMFVSRKFLVSVADLVPHGLPQMRSDDNGILVIPNLPKDGFIQVVLGHPRYADSSVTYLPVEREQRNILLREGKRVGGRVTYEGAGVAGVRVSVFKSGPQGQKEFAEVLTDSDGFFHARVHPDRYLVAVEHEDYASPAPAMLEVHPREEALPVSLALEAPRYIRGKVLYPDKKPCGGTRILYRKENTVFQDTFTNNDGAFSLRVPSGPGEIAIVPPRGYQSPNFGNIPVDLGEETSIDMKPIRLKRLPVITGVIRDQDGQEPGPVLVTILNLPNPYHVLTDEHGKLSLPLDFMPDLKKLQLRAEHGKRFQRVDIEVGLKKATSFDVQLAPFSPDLQPRTPVPGRNDLKGLVGKPAPELRGTQWINSEPLHLADLKGKVVVLLFWAGFDEDMGPVVIQELLTLHELLADVDDVAFVAVHDAISSAGEIQQYIDGYGIRFPVLRDEDEQTTFSTYGIVFIPQVVVLDKQGKVRYYQTDDRLLTCIKGLRRE